MSTRGSEEKSGEVILLCVRALFTLTQNISIQFEHVHATKIVQLCFHAFFQLPLFR